MTNDLVYSLIAKLIATAHKFRLGREAEASQQFRECLNLLEPILKSAPQADEITLILPAILAAQERYDWLALADYLEYELPSMLQGN